jgi:hypothetical protein
MRPRPRARILARTPMRQLRMPACLTCLSRRTQPILRTRLPMPVPQTPQPIPLATPAFQSPAQTSTGRASAERSATVVATPSIAEKPAHTRDGCAGTTCAPCRTFVQVSAVWIRLTTMSTAATSATAAAARSLVGLSVRRSAGSARTTYVSAGQTCASHGPVRMASLTIAATWATGAAARWIARMIARVCRWSRLYQNHLHVTGRRSLLRHHRRWLRRDSRLSRELPQWRHVRRGAHLRHGHRWRACAATTGAHPGTVGHLACTNAAPGAGPPSTVAASAGATASSHPATLLIPGFHWPKRTHAHVQLVHLREPRRS